MDEEIERWVSITFVVHGRKPNGETDYHQKQIIDSYDLPRQLYERKQWKIR